MLKCPICGESLEDILCQYCGYDVSLDYEKHPTITRIPLEIKSNRAANRAKADATVKEITFSEFKVEDDRLVKYCGISSEPRIPDGIRTIDKYAFAENKTIKTVTLPDTVTEIQEKAFYSCTNLQKTNFPPNLEIIGDGAFAYSGLSTAILPDSLMRLGDAVFSNTKIDRIRIPSKVTVIPKAAFRHCRWLHEVELCEGVETIDVGAFDFCGNLRTIFIPDSLKQVKGIQFVGTDQISSVIAGSEWKAKNTSILRTMIPSSCEADNFLIEGSVLVRYYGRAIRPNIPAGVRKIGKEAFALNSHIQSIAIPEGVRIIAARAFAECGNLRKVSLPKSLTRIGERAFVGTGLTSVEIPQNVYGIGMHAFGNCSKLEEITLHAGLMNIPISAFENCWKIRKIHAPEDWKNKHLDFVSAVWTKGK